MKHVRLLLKIILAVPLYVLMSVNCFLYLTRYVPKHGKLDNTAMGLLMLLLLFAIYDLFWKPDKK